MERRCGNGVKKGERIAFPLSFPPGFDLEKRVKDWVSEWQGLPYVSPYENAFHLNPYGDQAEKWTVAVLHELLWLLVSKKSESDNVFCLGEYLGFGDRFKQVLRHHPGIFYVSNKIRTQTVVLREAYKKDYLLEKHPLMGMRYRYIHLMYKSEKMQARLVRSAIGSCSNRRSLSVVDGSGERKITDEGVEERERKLNAYDSDSEDTRLSDSEYDESTKNHGEVMAHTDFIS